MLKYSKCHGVHYWYNVHVDAGMLELWNWTPPAIGCRVAQNHIHIRGDLAMCQQNK